jgi:NAD(P)-dependent dehydrogenase (short-subunit alcohol dehydrogenase family)
MASVGIVKRAADEHFGEGAPIWAIINNSGTAVFKPAEEQTEEEYDRQMALNCKVPFFLCVAL